MTFPVFALILDRDLLEIKVRWSIFTIISVCAGLPALAWSVRDVVHHKKNGHRISVFIILLLFTDFLELLLSPFTLIRLYLDDIVFSSDGTFQVLWALLLASRDCGFLLNQLVALEGILSVKRPLYTACVFSSPSFIIFHILVFPCIFIGHIIFDSLYRIFIAILVLIASVIAWMLSCGVSCSPDHRSHTSRKLDHHIVVVFIFTLLVLCLPFILILFFIFNLQPYHIYNIAYILWLLMSMRLISDPLLCVLVCRQNLRIQTSQNPEGTSLA